MTMFNAFNLCVDDPAIDGVLDCMTGKTISAQEAIGANFAQLEGLRMQLAEAKTRGQKVYCCPICWVPVYLACRRTGDIKRFFFKHYHEDGNCPAVTRDHPPRNIIDAMKYNGAKESISHINMKDWLARSLSFDPNFSDIQIEGRWCSGEDKGKWRKPDVRALWRGSVPVVFEIQLSTTYLHVIAERRVFYQNEGAMLCWVFRDFDANVGRLTQDDIFYNNNQNLFLVSEQTMHASKEAKALMMECRWSQPDISRGSIIYNWGARLASFSELTLDHQRQRVFLYDCEGEEAKLKLELPIGRLKNDFEGFWITYKPGQYDEAVWESLRTRFSDLGIQLPIYPSELQNLLDTLYSAKYGKLVGWGFSTLVELAHHVETKYKGYLWAFRLALNAFNRHEQIKLEDRTGRWRKKVKAYIESMRSGVEAYNPDRRFDDLVVFLFPEIAVDLIKVPADALN